MSWNRYPGSRLERQQSYSDEDVDSAPPNDLAADNQQEVLPSTTPVLHTSSSVFHLDWADDNIQDPSGEMEPKHEKYNGELGTEQFSFIQTLKSCTTTRASTLSGSYEATGSVSSSSTISLTT